jgi:phospholipase A1
MVLGGAVRISKQLLKERRRAFGINDYAGSSIMKNVIHLEEKEMSVIARFARRCAWAACAALACGGAAADLAECAAIERDDERLACYDQAAGRRPASAVPADSGAGAALTPLQEAWDLGESPADNFEIHPYRAVYLLPVFSASRINATPASPTRQPAELDGIRPVEAKFQISFKTKAATRLLGGNGDLWLGYTQSSRWQVYSKGISRPFRETVYEPEALFVWRTNVGIAGAALRYVGLGLNHQSNGRGGDLSRSWNRLTAQAGMEKGNWIATLRGWRRIGENPSNDDNPDIEKYLGHGELELTRKAGGHLLTAQVRFPALSNAKGALRMDWAFPISRGLRGHIQWFSGYGESLIDYNHRANYIGVGFSLVEPF